MNTDRWAGAAAIPILTLFTAAAVRLVHRLIDETKLRVQIAGAHAQTMAELTKAKSVVTVR